MIKRLFTVFSLLVASDELLKRFLRLYVLRSQKAPFLTM